MAQGETATAAQLSEGATALNSLIKAFQNDGIGINARQIIYPTLNTAFSYVTGTDGNTYRCYRSHTSGTASAPITGVDYNSYWIADDSGTPSAWVTSTGYTSLGDFAIGTGVITLDKATYKYSGNDYVLTIVPLDEYFGYTNKWFLGEPEVICYDKSNDKCYLYPQPPNTGYITSIVGVKMLQDMDASDNDFELPNRAVEMMSWGLSYLLSFEYGLPSQRVNLIKTEYDRAQKLFSAFDIESRVPILQPTVSMVV